MLRNKFHHELWPSKLVFPPHPELGLSHRVGRPVGSPSWSLVCWSCRNMEGFLIRGWDLILPASGATSALARDAIPTTSWVHEPQPVSNRLQVMGLGFPHRARRYRPEGSPFSSLGWSCRDLERFLNRGRQLSSPGAGAPCRWPEGQLSPRADSMSPSQSAISQWGWGFHAVWGDIDPENLRFRPRLLEL